MKLCETIIRLEFIRNYSNTIENLLKLIPEQMATTLYQNLCRIGDKVYTELSYGE